MKNGKVAGLNILQTFVEIARTDAYNKMYNALYEMGAGADMLKKFEKLQNAPMQEFSEGVEWARIWSNAKLIEMMKDAYRLSKKELDSEIVN